MEYSFFAKLAAEFLGTAILVILGNGSVDCLLYTI